MRHRTGPSPRWARSFGVASRDYPSALSISRNERSHTATGTILSLDLGKFKTLACWYDVASGAARRGAVSNDSQATLETRIVEGNSRAANGGRVRRPVARGLQASSAFGLGAFFHGLHIHHGNLHRGGRYHALFPVIEGHGHRCDTQAGFVRDPHGAVELVPSAPLLQHIFPRHRLLTRFLGWELHLDGRVNVLRDQVETHGHERPRPKPGSSQE